MPRHRLSHVENISNKLLRSSCIITVNFSNILTTFTGQGEIMASKPSIQNKMSKSEEEMKEESCVLLLFVRGRRYPGRWLKKENIEASLDFQPRDTDIIITAFPKNGTNWMKYIVHTLITRGQKPVATISQLFFETVPLLDLTGLAPLENLPDPRPIHYHLPYDMIPKNPNAKYIYILRNPKDTVVSCYHYTVQTDKLNITFDKYFDTFMKGLVAYGDYFDHVLSWYERRNDPNVLFMSYEQLQADTTRQLLEIAKFIGKNYYEEFAEDNELMEKVLQLTSFQNMKKSLIDGPTPIPGEEVKFFRKGIVGDWKNHLSPEQNRRMDARIQEKFGGTEIIDMFNANRSWI